MMLTIATKLSNIYNYFRGCLCLYMYSRVPQVLFRNRDRIMKDKFTLNMFAYKNQLFMSIIGYIKKKKNHKIKFEIFCIDENRNYEKLLSI